MAQVNKTAPKVQTQLKPSDITAKLAKDKKLYDPKDGSHVSQNKKM